VITDLLDDIEAIRVGQTEVEDDKVSGAFADHVERSARIARGRDDIALAPQARAQKANDRRLVVDDQKARRSRARHHGRVPGGVAVAATGSVIVKTAPFRPVRFAAVILPPMASMKPRADRKTKPRAGALAVAAADPVELVENPLEIGTPIRRILTRIQTP